MAEPATYEEMEVAIARILDAETEDFIQLSHLAGLDPLTDYVAADLRDSDLSGIDLRGINFRKTYLRGANLSQANLAGANLQDANLSQANLKGAILTGAILTGACIENWQIDERTNLDRVVCDYIYLRAKDPERDRSLGDSATALQGIAYLEGEAPENLQGYGDRLPRDSSQTFVSGEFARHFSSRIAEEQTPSASAVPKAYHMTLNDAIADYRSGLISATALLYYYLKIHSAPGYKMTLHQPEISEVLGISRAAFYKAIQRLKDKGLIRSATALQGIAYLEGKAYHMTLNDAIADYRSGLISATALLYYYLKIHSAPGYKMTLHQPEISEVLGISKAGFYKAIQRLKDKGLIRKKAPNMLVVALGSPLAGDIEESARLAW